jgi:hypothetical protein
MRIPSLQLVQVHLCVGLHAAAIPMVDQRTRIVNIGVDGLGLCVMLSCYERFDCIVCTRV